MMFIDLVRARRTVRDFKDQQIESEKMAILEECALRAFSSRRLDPWEFIFVQDREMLSGLGKAKHGTRALLSAPLGIVIAADTDKSDVWVEDCSVAACMLSFAAEDLDLGSCWIQIRNRNRPGMPETSGETADAWVRRLLDIPENFSVAAIIAIGYPGAKEAGHPPENLSRNKIHYGKF